MRILHNEPLAPLTWFRVGGPARTLYLPDTPDDLANVPSGAFVLGLGSNVIIRDGGVDVAVRLGRAFGAIIVEPGARIRAGAAAPLRNIAKVAQQHQIDGLAFLSGIPGSVGGALRMNAGAYGREIRDVVISAEPFLPVFSYRHAEAPDDTVFLSCTFQGTPGDPTAEMDAIRKAREATQPVRSRTGGSTFRNPTNDHRKAWQLIDAAGCRGMVLGDAMVSDMHCNFLINRGNATATDLEALGETVRTRVADSSGVQLEWEIVRIGAK